MSGTKPPMKIQMPRICFILWGKRKLTVNNVFLIPLCPCIELALPQAVQLDTLFLFTTQLVEMHLLEGPDLGHNTNLLWGEKGKERIRKKPSTRQDSYPQSLEFLLLGRVLYRCATTATLQGLILLQKSFFLSQIWKPKFPPKLKVWPNCPKLVKASEEHFIKINWWQVYNNDQKCLWKNSSLF